MTTPLRPPVKPKYPPMLQAALDRLNVAEDFPAVSGQIQQLMEVLGDEDANIQKLANLILQDYGLTVKLLRDAHSFRFNRSGAPVVSVTHAIVMMGAASVRNLVSGIVVFQHFQRRSPGLRPLLMLSLLSANHARELAVRNRTNREEAYLLGMLRNLGEVLVACYMPDQYAAVLRDMANGNCGATLSCRRVLHFEYEDLARAVMRAWNMPESFARVLSDTSVSDDQQAFVSFAHRLTSIVYRDGATPLPQAVNLLLQKHSSLGLTREQVAAILETGIEGTKDTFTHAGLQLNELQLRHQMTAALMEDPAYAAAHQEGGDASAPTAEAVLQMMAQIDAAVDNPQIDLNKIILMILEATLGGGGFDRAVLALASPTRKEVTARLGLGRATEELIARFRFTLGPSGGPIGVALSRAQELVVAKQWELVPDEQRLLRTVGAGALVLLPLVLSGRTIGGLYVDTAAATPPTDGALAVARQMRDAIAKAMVRRGQQAQKPVSA
jgi:HD-like signal output (HDOD) protein